MADTIRQRILNELATRIAAMEDDDSNPLWNFVSKGTAKAGYVLQYPVVHIEEGPEETNDRLFPYIDKTLTIYVDFRFNQLLGVDSFDTFNYYLGRLQSTLFGSQEKITLGGLCMDLQETGANPEIEGAEDDSPGGVLFFNCRYRHVNGNPYQLHPGG